MSDTKALDFITKRHSLFCNCAFNTSAGTVCTCFTDQAASELAQIQIMLASIEHENLTLMEINTQLRAELEKEKNRTVPYAVLVNENELLSAALDEAKKFHPRAMKLIAKKKNFLVVAEDEPYFMRVYSIIKKYEEIKGTWTTEDEMYFHLAVVAFWRSYPTDEGRKE